MARARKWDCSLILWAVAFWGTFAVLVLAMLWWMAAGGGFLEGLD